MMDHGLKVDIQRVVYPHEMIKSIKYKRYNIYNKYTLFILLCAVTSMCKSVKSEVYLH